MSIQLRRWSFSMAAAASLALAACEDGENGTGATVTVTAPGIVSPNTTTPTSDSQPTLTVSNATVSDGTTPTYAFQVATDQAFGSIVVQVSGIAQGSGQTSWEVSQSLGNGTYFWRARADAAGTSGPYSGVAQFVVSGAVGGAGETIVARDELTGGSTIATTRNGGTFTAQGWRVDTNSDFLRYVVPSIENGYVQWENLGMTPRGANDASHMLFGMWDPAAGAYRQNPFRVHLQKLWPNPHNPPFLRFRWISQGREHEGTNNFMDWDPGRVYTWRVEWGPEAGAHTARAILDGMVMMQIRYNQPYQPDTHFIELGVAERHESVIDAVYRNLVIVRR